MSRSKGRGPIRRKIRVIEENSSIKLCGNEKRPKDFNEETRCRTKIGQLKRESDA